MSIDYDELREWLRMVERENRGRDGVVEFTYPGSTVEIIHELIRLHDGLGKLLSVMAYDSTRLHKDHYPLTRKYLATYADKLTELLKGDTE